MSCLEKLKFPALNIDGTNYVLWELEAHNYLVADGLDATIQENFNPQDTPALRSKAAKAICLLLRHLHQQLKANYLGENDPKVIWDSLKLRFDTDRKQTLLPLLLDEWNKLCFYNYKTVTEYSTTVYRVTTELHWCGKTIDDAEKIEKTLSTFNPAERILSMQHRQANYQVFDKLIAALLLQERQGELLQKNHDERPAPQATPPIVPQPKPEANFNSIGNSTNAKKKRWMKPKHKGSHKKSKFPTRHKDQDHKNKNSKSITCHKCGLRGHWANKCRTSAFHCKLYNLSLSKKSQDNNHPNAAKRSTFMTDFSDEDSGAECHYAESKFAMKC